MSNLDNPIHPKPTQETLAIKPSSELLDPTIGRKRTPPRGWKWRSSSWYLTTVVAVAVGTDAITYSIVVPVIPFRLEALGYDHISVLTSWLFFAYVIPILIISFPMAFFLHRTSWRTRPLIAAVLVLEGALFLLGFAKPYWAMVLARCIQGCASAVVWSVGFALICENVPKENVGRQIGFAWAGLPIGVVIAPPIGGALYQRLGWAAPQVFCAIVCLIDLAARLLVIERKELAKYEIQDSTENPAKIDKASPPTETKAEEGSPSSISSRLLFIAGGPPVHASISPIHNAEDLEGSTNDIPTVAEESGSQRLPEINVEKTEEKHHSMLKVLYLLASSPRGMTALWVQVVYGLLFGVIDPTLTLRVNTIWNKDSIFVGFIYLIACVPTAIGCPLAGWLADKYGSELVVLPSLFLLLPWTLLLMLDKSLAGFIIFFTMWYLFLSNIASPVGLEVSKVAQETEGIGEIHQFAALNIAYSAATAIGTMAGGQIYDRIPLGWQAICWLCFSCVLATVPLTMAFMGDNPLLGRLRGTVQRRRSDG